MHFARPAATARCLMYDCVLIVDHDFIFFLILFRLPEQLIFEEKL